MRKRYRSLKTSSENDRIRLCHALESAQKARRFADGHTRASLGQDEGLQLILARLLEILGEATGAVSPEFRAHYPDLPWPSMRAMRNWLAHAYFDINLDTLWNVVENLIGPLIAQLEAILAAEIIDCSELE
ncbi:MAG: DUF86 domain-containing protein [Chloroflexota bacterium]|nr:DUF86 domain-containing protein [Chloroflexota bacterium]